DHRAGRRGGVDRGGAVAARGRSPRHLARSAVFEEIGMPPSTTEEQGRRRHETPYIPLPRTGIGERDVRAKRPPLLSFWLRMETLRRVSRVLSLLALDVGGVFLAIFT